MNFVDNSKLILKPGMYGASGNYYRGLSDFSEMLFLLHFLRKDDLFVDIGANVGVYTVLASANCLAESISCEPVKESREDLIKNLELNQISSLVEVRPVGVSDKAGEAFFTSEEGPKNHIVDSGGAAIKVETLDQIVKDRTPILLKIDTEGHDYQVLLGADKLLRNPSLEVVFVELWRQRKVHELLLSYGFKGVVYDPVNREISDYDGFKRNNGIYLRRPDFVSSRLKAAKKFSIIGLNL